MAKRPRERSSELLDVRILDSGAVGPITNDLASFLAPLSRDEFLSEFYRKKALVVKIHPRFREARLKHIQEMMNGFNPKQMLQHSSSDRINVWMGAGDTLHSVKVSAEEAMGCYSAGCGLYFRANEDLESEFVPAFSEALGHSFASYFRDGQRRGEIETFATHIGHTTQWHSDFQENFTVQLRGTKKWYFYKSPVPHPHRAYAPHFKNQSVLHTQHQTIRAANPEFQGLPEDIDEMCESVVLQPGDVLYHPAGIFHRVDTIAATEADTTNSLSINISLFPQQWGHLIAESTHQLSLTMPSLRERVRFDSLEDAHQQIGARLAELSKHIASLKPSMVLPAAALSPVGVATVNAKGVTRDDGKVVKAVNEAKIVGPWKRNPIGVLSLTPEHLEVPLRQRPAKDDESSDDEESEEDGSVEVPEDYVRYDYHANYIAGETTPDMTPAVHCVLLVHKDVSAVVSRLASIAGGKDVPQPSKAIPAGLITLLLDLGFMA
jgi:hypothetical protein